MKLVPAVIAGASIIVLSLIGASPASAAGNTIDPGDSLYAIPCREDAYNDWQFFGVESTTAFSTAIGDGAGEETNVCAGQPAYDPSTGKSYYIQWDGEESFLAEIDVVTGESAVIGDFYYDNNEFPESLSPYSIAIGADGSAYVLADGGIWSLDLDTAWVTPINESINTYAFAFDSVTGKFYAIDYTNEIYEINVETGEETLLGDIGFPDDNTGFATYSLQFDGAGTFWIEVDHFSEGDFFRAELWSFTLATVASPVFSGAFAADNPYYTEAILIVPGVVAPVEPALAATGADLADVLPWAIGAAVIVLAGGVLLILRSRRKPAAITTAEQPTIPEIESKD